MRVAALVNQYPPLVTAGLGRYVELITPRLAQELDLTVYTLNDGDLPVEERDGRVTVVRPRLRLLGAFTGRRRLNRTSRAQFLLLTLRVVASNAAYVLRLRRGPRPDLVAVHDSTNFLGALASHYLLRLPLVLHVHTTEYGVARERTVRDPLGLFGALERWLARVSRRVVVATPEVREELLAAGWTRTPIDVVVLGGTYEPLVTAEGFDLGALAAEGRKVRAGLGIADGDPVLLFVGRIERQKGVYPLVEALPRIVAAVPGLRLVMVGEGDAAGVRRLADAAGAGDHLLLSEGFVAKDDLPAYYAMADACVFPSLFEPFGLVATEAMALGRPTLLGDGFSRIFEGDPAEPAAVFTGPGDAEALARAVIAVMGDAGLRAALGERGRRLVGERLSWPAAAAGTLESYRAALGEGR